MDEEDDVQDYGQDEGDEIDEGADVQNAAGMNEIRMLMCRELEEMKRMMLGMLEEMKEI